MDEGLSMKLVFISSSKFSLRYLSACLKMPKLNVTGVVTSPQTFAITCRHGSVTNELHADVVGLTSLHTIPVQTLVRWMNEPSLSNEVAAWGPDIFLVAGCSNIIPKQFPSPIERKRPYCGLQHKLHRHQQRTYEQKGYLQSQGAEVTGGGSNG
jgi:hypothetical protein